MPGSPGEAAGIHSGDTILAVDGTAVRNWHDFVLLVRGAAERQVRIDLSRNGTTIAVDVVPEAISERGKRIGRIGVAVAESRDASREVRVFVRYGFLRRAPRRSWRLGTSRCSAW